MIPQPVLRSEAWQSVVAHLHAEILALRELNDEKADQEETAFTRGQIAALKKLLGQGRDPSPDMQTEGEFGDYRT